MRRRFAGSFVFALVFIAGFPVPGPSAQAPAPVVVAVDVVAVDRNGRTVDDLGLQDFAVSIDGQPRRVLSVRQVSRGPGSASNAASRQANGGRAGTFAAEPSRTVLVVVDETMLRRGDERVVIQAASAFLDRLGLDDHVAVVRLPATTRTRVELTTDRPAAREALRALTGQPLQAGVAADDKAGPPEGASRATTVDPNRVAAVDPDRVANPPDREQQIVAAPELAPPAMADGDLERARASLTGLGNLLKGLDSIPGRKVVALFTAGLPPVSVSLGAQVDALSAAAAGARAVVHTFGLRFAHADDPVMPDFSAIESLTKKTGGTFAVLEKDAGRAVEPVIAQLSACYVLQVEAGATATGSRPYALRAETTRKGVTLRSAAWVVARDDPEDALVPAARPETQPEAQPSPPADTRAASREADLEMILSRMTDYVRGYQRAFSGLVAEETYEQQIPGQSVRLRSDFLLVKLQTADYWQSFRDVFEVDGKPVRDRNERLKRLFLDNPGTEALAQVRRIQDESARHNIGPVERNFNVPLFPLTFLLPDTRGRFHFTVAKKGNSDGLETWRVEYQEQVHPTMIRNPRMDTDIPASGWFMVDPVTGAILETGLNAETSVNAYFEVRYRRDAELGLWVPARMSEMYTSRVRQDLVMGAQATYSNFRRFQVKTEETITIPK
jgi:VWFA-related protein